MNQASFSFKTVPNIHVELGCSKQLVNEVKRLGGTRPLLVSDQGVLNAGLLENALKSLREAGFSHGLYADVLADPSDKIVTDAVTKGLEFDCDCVVGFGGGSSMDVAKLVAVLAKQQQSLADCYGVDQITSSRLPLIQIPTTAGTGSEATSVAIVTTGETTKAGVVSPVLFADTILLDADLTIGLPPAVTAATGIDAMVHAIEAFTSKRLKNPISDMLAKEALSLMSASIHKAVHEGEDLQARSQMLLGAMYAGQAFANSPVGAVHALAYPLGGIFHIPHGLSNSLVLPHVLRFNAPYADPLYEQLLDCIEMPKNKTNSGSAGHKLADYFLQLAGDLGLPSKLSDMNIAEADLAKLASEAMLQQRLLINNPREVSEQEALVIYQQAF